MSVSESAAILFSISVSILGPDLLDTEADIFPGKMLVSIQSTKYQML